MSLKPKRKHKEIELEDILLYEISPISEFIGWKWLQRVMAHLLALRVRPKLERYRKRIALRDLMEFRVRSTRDKDKELMLKLIIDLRNKGIESPLSPQEQADLDMLINELNEYDEETKPPRDRAEDAGSPSSEDNGSN